MCKILILRNQQIRKILLLGLSFSTKWKRWSDRVSNPGTLIYKVNSLLIKIPGRQTSCSFSGRETFKQKHLVYHVDSSIE